MSRRLLAILLSELATVRLVCGHPGCGAVTEMPLPRLELANPATCSVCGKSFGALLAQNKVLSRLARVMAEAQQLAEHVAIEFVLPEEADGTP